MHGYLYLIENNINNKVYIGKTYINPEDRFEAHIKDSLRFPNRKFYKAINKYGKNNFTLNIIGSFEQGTLELMEQSLISGLDSYKNGYNSTLGGDGKRYLDADLIISTYKELKSITAVSNHLKHDSGHISTILKSCGIKIDSCRPNSKTNILLVELDKKFNSVKECAEYLISSGVSSADYRSTARSILRVLDGSRKSYLKMTFCYF